MTLPTRPFILIRHGQTDANRDGRIAGVTEAQLTDNGRACAAALQNWPWPSALAVFASPQQRALETAALAFPGHDLTPLPGLRERDWGVFENRPVAELPPRETTPEGGEAWDDMLSRVAAALHRAVHLAADNLPVLVAHSGVIRAARHLTGGTAHGPSPDNTTPYLFAPSPTGWRETKLTQKDISWTA
ncbi:MAG: histidine phosphatase family protein [Sulfitobacter sp.]